MGFLLLLKFSGIYHSHLYFIAVIFTSFPDYIKSNLREKAVPYTASYYLQELKECPSLSIYYRNIYGIEFCITFSHYTKLIILLL